MAKWGQFPPVDNMPNYGTVTKKTLEAYGFNISGNMP